MWLMEKKWVTTTSRTQKKFLWQTEQSLVCSWAIIIQQWYFFFNTEFHSAVFLAIQSEQTANYSSCQKVSTGCNCSSVGCLKCVQFHNWFRLHYVSYKRELGQTMMTMATKTPPYKGMHYKSLYISLRSSSA